MVVQEHLVQMVHQEAQEQVEEPVVAVLLVKMERLLEAAGHLGLVEHLDQVELQD